MRKPFDDAALASLVDACKELPPMTDDEKRLQRLDFAYGQLASSTNHKPVRAAFYKLAIESGLSTEKFGAWASEKEWWSSVTPATNCTCYHAPEQHGPNGCGTIALIAGACPCKWDGQKHDVSHGRRENPTMEHPEGRWISEASAQAHERAFRAEAPTLSEEELERLKMIEAQLEADPTAITLPKGPWQEPALPLDAVLPKGAIFRFEPEPDVCLALREDSGTMIVEASGRVVDISMRLPFRQVEVLGSAVSAWVRDERRRQALYGICQMCESAPGFCSTHDQALVVADRPTELNVDAILAEPVASVGEWLWLNDAEKLRAAVAALAKRALAIVVAEGRAPYGEHNARTAILDDIAALRKSSSDD